MKMIKIALSVLVLVVAGSVYAQEEGEPIMVKMTTSLGSLTLELYPEAAPVTVSNFLEYVDSGFYEGTVFHRVIRNFMIQGGGFDAKLSRKKTLDAIKNEAANGLKNDRGTIAMARTSVPDSATSQFFINTVDNAFLNYKDDSPQGIGYCVFGKVVEGMDIVDAIQAVSTGIAQGMQDVPNEPVLIEKVEVVTEEAEPATPDE